MTDMLVKLYDLPSNAPSFSELIPPEVIIRKPIGTEKLMVMDWVKNNFETIWGSEMDMAFSRIPVSCYLAQQGKEIIGFACYDATTLGYFGPMGVLEIFQGKGIGKALLLACLYEMKLKGYGYAIIGWVGPQEFYAKTVGAIVIPDSTPGIWKDWIGSE